MAPFAALEVRDGLLIVQITVTVVAGIPAYLALYLFWIHRKSLTLNAMAMRHQMFVALTDSVSKEAHDTAMLHMRDWFDETVFDERYKNHPQRIQSYILMQRKYLYLVFSSFVEKGFPVQEKAVAQCWIKELGEFHEFHDVHARHGRYYPEFAAEVTRILAGSESSGWMCLTE